jgi:hypothetical protein
MVGDIIEQTSAGLAERLGELFEDGAVAGRLAVGYLFFKGLVSLSDDLARLPEVYLLIGNVVNRLTVEQIQEETMQRPRGGEGLVRDQEDVAATSRTVHDRFAAETALNIRRTIEGLERTPEMRTLLLTMARRIADRGLKVRVFREGRLHSKLCLVEYPERDGATQGVAIVGSSNVTLGGPSHRTELNVVVRDAQSIRELKRWYSDLWNHSQDFHRELFDELGASWAFT